MKAPARSLWLLWLVALLGCQRLIPSRSIDEVLIYEPTDTEASDATIDKLVDDIKARLGTDAASVTRAGSRIQIVLSHLATIDAAEIDHWLDTKGTSFELRIVANPHDHAKILALAAAQKGSIVVDDEGKPLARWLPVVASARDFFGTKIGTSARRSGENDVELLVVNDDLNISGADLQQVSASYDQVGMPSVSFELTRVGASKLGELTTRNLPVGDARSQLAIIIDGQVQSAPTINGAIYERGEITGTFTSAEVKATAAALRNSMPPIPVKLIRSETVSRWGW